MPHGGPDWGTAGPLTAIFTIEDMGELAARLGSIVTHDRRGNVIMLDDFENSILKWHVYAPDANEYIILDSASVRSGSQAARLHCRNVVGSEVYMYKSAPPLASRQLGFEVSFSRFLAYGYLEAWLGFTDATYAFHAAVRFHINDRKLSVITTGGAYVEIASGLRLYFPEFTFHTIKIVADFQRGLYKRVILDEVEYPIPTIPLWPASLAGDRNTTVTVLLHNNYAYAGDTWIDDAILTENEP